MSQVVKLTQLAVDNSNKSEEFLLLPSNPSIPIITSQIAQNFSQYTWLTQTGSSPTYQTIQINSTSVNILQGTEFSFGVRASDPSNLANPSDTINLSFKWKKNDSQLYELSQLNNGAGVRAVLITSESCTPQLSGIYTCDVSNAYGTITTDPLTINIINPLDHPKLHKNLILNGDGEGGTDGWSIGDGIVVNSFLTDLALSKNFGSFNLGGFITYNALGDLTIDNTTGDVPEFRFSDGPSYGMFYNWFFKRLKLDPSYHLPGIRSNPETIGLTEGEQWMMESVLPQIVPNEDYNKTSTYAAFFPGLLWMDQYNKNTGDSQLGLYNESKDRPLTYFTRDKLRFTKFGGKRSTSMNQTLDITDIADFVDGNVYGVNYLTSQFFAYVGIGITNYKIRLQVLEGGLKDLRDGIPPIKKEYNYQITDAYQVWDHVYDSNKYEQARGGAGSGPRFAEAGSKKIYIAPNSDIEIIPIADDTTNIVIDFADDQGRILQTQTVNGPDIKDIWAVKEKAYFPTTLYPIFEFVEPNGNNNITIFNQKYSDTKSLLGFFDSFNQQNNSDSKGLFSKGIYPESASLASFRAVSDQAAKFFLLKYDFSKYNTAYPTNAWYFDQTRTQKALPDYGAAAMFGIGGNMQVPTGTRLIKVTVNFNHNSTIIDDPNPEQRGWTSLELYGSEYGENSLIDPKLSEYGSPRCGITKAKLILIPNEPELTESYISYRVPPLELTALGLQKQQYSNPQAFNTADSSQFNYNLLIPDAVPSSGSLNINAHPQQSSSYSLSLGKASVDQKIQVSGSK